MQLKFGSREQLALREAGHDPLAEHALLSPTEGDLPAHQIGGGEPRQPAALLFGEVERIGPGLAIGDLQAHPLQPQYRSLKTVC